MISFSLICSEVIAFFETIDSQLFFLKRKCFFSILDVKLEAFCIIYRLIDLKITPIFNLR